jgi:hypothetical protein
LLLGADLHVDASGSEVEDDNPGGVSENEGNGGCTAIGGRGNPNVDTSEGDPNADTSLSVREEMLKSVRDGSSGKSGSKATFWTTFSATIVASFVEEDDCTTSLVEEDDCTTSLVEEDDCTTSLVEEDDCFFVFGFLVLVCLAFGRTAWPSTGFTQTIRSSSTDFVLFAEEVPVVPCSLAGFVPFEEEPVVLSFLAGFVLCEEEVPVVLCCLAGCVVFEVDEPIPVDVVHDVPSHHVRSRRNRRSSERLAS